MNKQEIIKKVIQIMQFNEQEMNDLKFNLALKLDRRTYCMYYISLLRTNI